MVTKGIIFFTLIVFLFSKTSADKGHKSSSPDLLHNISITSERTNNYYICSHTETFSEGTYCDGKYEVHKVYDSGDPGNFSVSIFEEGFCPMIEWVDQGSRAEAYNGPGMSVDIIVYLRYKKLFTFPGGSIDVYSYYEIDIYRAYC